MPYLERRYLIAAKRHHGKSTFAVWLAAQIESDPGVDWTIAYVVQADAADIYRAAGYVECERIPEAVAAMAGGQRRIMLRPPTTAREAVLFCLRLRQRNRERTLTLIIDELIDESIVSTGPAPQLKLVELRTLVVVERGANFIAGTQAPVGVPMILRQLCEEWYLGRITHTAALDRLAQIGVPDPMLAELPSVPPHEFLTWQTD